MSIEFDNGEEWLVKGRGAGCWPTAEAVIADLLDIHDEMLEQRWRDSVSATYQPSLSSRVRNA